MREDFRRRVDGFVVEQNGAQIGHKLSTKLAERQETEEERRLIEIQKEEMRKHEEISKLEELRKKSVIANELKVR